MITLGSTGMLEPQEPPYHGFSIQGVMEKLLSLEIPQFCMLNISSREPHRREADKCCKGIRRPLNEMLLRVYDEKIGGLPLRDMVLR